MFLRLNHIINPDLFKVKQDVTRLRLMLVISLLKPHFSFPSLDQTMYIPSKPTFSCTHFSLIVILWDLFNKMNTFFAVFTYFQTL